MKLGSHESSDNYNLINLFANFLLLPISKEKNFDVSFIDQGTISKHIQQLKSSHAAGPDGVSSSILEYHSQLLSIPLTYFFNKSLK